MTKHIIGWSLRLRKQGAGKKASCNQHPKHISSFKSCFCLFCCVRRDRDEREAQDKEAAERDKIKNMTDEERAAYFRANPRVR